MLSHGTATSTADHVFQAAPARLFGIALRMLGVRADAEHVVQDARLRWQAADTALQSAAAEHRQALQWAEAVNAVPQRTPGDEEFEAVRRHFREEQVAELAFALGAICAWNMLNASFHMPVPETPSSGG